MDKNTFAPTPPMGWNSYDYYNTEVNEDQVRANADYIAAHLKDYGWEYVVVDIQWYAVDAGTQSAVYQYIPFGEVCMDECSRLIPDPARFPSSSGGRGFGPLADYVHSLGLKFGIHIMRGIPRAAAHNHMPLPWAVTKETDWSNSGADTGRSTDGGTGPRPDAELAADGCAKHRPDAVLTADRLADPSNICPWNPDMYGLRTNLPEAQLYYNAIMELYASWGVDFIKCDDICREDAPTARREMELLHRAIASCGRPIVLSLSPGPAKIAQAAFYAENANMWRITDDFWDTWPLLKDMFRRCELWEGKTRPGCYPDCDMLPLGTIGGCFGDRKERRAGLTEDEQRTMMTLWCLFGSPLMVGAELTKMDPFTHSLLTNREVLKMRLCAQNAFQLERTDDHAIWASWSDDRSTTACEATGYSATACKAIRYSTTACEAGGRGLAADSTDARGYVALFNLADEERAVHCWIGQIEARGGKPWSGEPLRELWTGAPAPIRTGSLACLVPPHGVKVFTY